MTQPTIFDIRNDADAARFRLSTTEPTRNSGGVPARDYLLGQRIEGRGGNAPSFIVLHIQDGATHGSLDHWVAGHKWREDPATGQWVETDQPIQASATVMIQKDGSVLRVIPEEHGPWTNGDVTNPTAQAAGLLALGPNPADPDPNHFCLTIEAEGKPSDAMPDAQLAAVVWQCQTWIDRYGIPIANILPHSAINSVGRAHCPGPYEARVLAALGGGQEHDIPLTTVPPTPPPPFDGQPKTVDGVLFNPFKREVTSNGVERRKFPSPTAPPTGPSIAPGVKIPVVYWVKGEDIDGNAVWLIGESGSNIWSGGVLEAVP